MRIANPYLRFAAAVICGSIGIFAGVAVQRAFWPAVPAAPVSPAAEFPAPVLAPSAIDWNKPPLPPDTKVNFSLSKGAGVKIQAQFLCEASLSPSAVVDFYKSQLAHDGWSLYNGEIGKTPAAAENMIFFRRCAAGSQQCWFTVFAAKNGKTAFRLSVLPRAPH